MLKQLEIENLKSLAHTKLQLAPLTLLTGANSSGKSTVIQALMLLSKYSQASNRYSMEELTRYLNVFADIRNKNNNAKQINIVALDADNNLHSLIIQSDNQNCSKSLPYIYEPSFDNEMPELFYLNANRIGAQEWVPVSERKVGNLSEFIFSTFEKIKGQVLPEPLLKFSGSKTIAYQVAKWLSLITGTQTELVSEKNGDQVKIAFNVKNLETDVSPFNLGAGVSYVAKVIILCFMAKKGDLVFLENPEVQLHPKAQAELGTFLSFIANSGIQLIVETHCEHLINKVAYEVYEENIKSNQVVIHYKNDTNSNFVTILIDENGEFNNIDGEVIGFPAGFFDATLSYLLQMR
ncbi:MAG: AAA family ATPase [Shewanella sp.]|uniref:AAA family ATPase n=1 Tax=Shewanella sp. TaxID=50422 RepID=UPI003F38E8BF